MIVSIRDNSDRAKAVVVVFILFIIMYSVGIVSSYYELELLQRMQLGVGNFTMEEAESNDSRQAIIGIINLIIYIATAIVFLNWFRRAYGNLIRLGVRTEHSETMTIWAWIIPVLSFFFPVQIMSEICRSTKKKIKEYDSNYIFKGLGLIIVFWWTLFLLGNFAGNFLFSSIFDDQELSDMIINSWAYLITDSLQIIEAILVIVIVSRVSEMENKLAKEVKRAGGLVIDT